MTRCTICWTCRGLFTDNTVSDYNMEAHIKSCNGADRVNSMELFEYFVCDKADFSVLINLKKCLNKHGRRALSNIQVQAALPGSIIKALTALCTSDIPHYQIKQPSKQSQSYLSQNQNKEAHTAFVNENNFTHIREEKSSQTNIQTPVTSADVKAVVTDPENKDSVNTGITDISSVFCDNISIASCNELSGEDKSKHTEKTCFSVSSETAEGVPPEEMKDVLTHIKELIKQDEMKLSAQCSIMKNGTDCCYVCKLCTYKTNSDKRMLRHLEVHNDGRSFECSACTFTTIWRKEWKQHLRRKHEEQKHTCTVCSAVFIRNDMLTQHVSSTHPEIASATEKAKLHCDECDYVTGKPATLKEHKRKHTGEVVVCPHDGCEFKSTYERSLHKHLRQKHAAEKNLSCQMCSFTTRHASSLRKHMMLIHKEFKPYRCAQCSFTALYPSEVIAHAKSKHLKQKRFACPLCQFQTSYALTIQKHIERHKRAGGYSCTVCGEAMDSLCKAKKHMKESHGCAEYKIINESVEGKVKPNDYKIKRNDKSLEDAVQVMIIQTDSIMNNEAVSEKSIVDGILIDSEFAARSDILQEPAPSQNMAEDMTLDHDSSIYNTSTQPSKGGNPMLSAISNDLGDTDNSLIEDSLFDLMSDFPRPPTLNRSQSASTLMFASFSPHLIDRPMTPDFFFTDSPSVGTFFPSFSSKSLDTESLNLGGLGPFDPPSQPLSATSSNVGLTAPVSVRGNNPPSPILPNFVSSPCGGSSGPLTTLNMSSSLIQEPGCMDVDSILPNTVLSGLSQLNPNDAESPSSPSLRMTRSSFITNTSAFAAVGQDYNPEIQAAVASIPAPDEADSTTQHRCMTSESPFPDCEAL